MHDVSCSFSLALAATYTLSSSFTFYFIQLASSHKKTFTKQQPGKSIVATVSSRAKPTASEACCRWWKHSSLWLGGTKCFAQRHCTGLTDTPLPTSLPPSSSCCTRLLRCTDKDYLFSFTCNNGNKMHHLWERKYTQIIVLGFTVSVKFLNPRKGSVPSLGKWLTATILCLRTA